MVTMTLLLCIACVLMGFGYCICLEVEAFLEKVHVISVDSRGIFYVVIYSMRRLIQWLMCGDLLVFHFIRIVFLVIEKWVSLSCICLWARVVTHPLVNEKLLYLNNFLFFFWVVGGLGTTLLHCCICGSRLNCTKKKSYFQPANREGEGVHHCLVPQWSVKLGR